MRNILLVILSMAVMTSCGKKPLDSATATAPTSIGQQTGNNTNSTASELARQSAYQSLGQAAPPWVNVGDCETGNPDFYRCQAWVMTRDNRASNPALRSAPLSPPTSFSAISINIENTSVSGGTAEVRLGVQAKCEFLSPTSVFGGLLECSPSQTLTTKVIVRLQADDLLHNNWRVTGISEDPQIVGQRQAQHQANENTAARQQQEGQHFVQLANAVCRDNDIATARQALEQGVGDVNTPLVVLRQLMPDPCIFAYDSFLEVAIDQRHYDMAALLVEHGANVNKAIGPNNLTPLYYALSNNGGDVPPSLRRLALECLQYGADPAPAVQGVSGWTRPELASAREAILDLLRTPVVRKQ